MVFELINNSIENILISFFISQYLKLDDNILNFILSTVVINTILSTILSYLNIIGITQTLLIQTIIVLFLYKYHENFSFQDIITSLFVNILLFISIYISIYMISLLYNLTPSLIYQSNTLYIVHVFLSKLLFIFLIYVSLKTRPLKFSKIQIKEQNYLLLFEFLIVIVMAYYFLSNTLIEKINILSFFSSFGFLLLFFLFCYIFNRIIIINQELYETKLKNKQNYYKLENLKNLNTIKNHTENIEHRINYILQSIEYDLKNKNYNAAIKKINYSKELVHNIAPALCTNNELFDFLINMELKYYIQNKKKIKICAFISENHAYDNYEIINYIIDSLKIIYNISDKLELFLTENENHILKIKYIIQNDKNYIIEELNNNFPKKTGLFINININECLILITVEVNLNDYM